MNRIKVAVAAGAVGALALAAPLVAMPKGTDEFNNSSQRADATNCGNGNSLYITYPAKLWPPNHKYYEDIHVVANDTDGNTITLLSTGTHDQYTGTDEENGSGNTLNDARVADGEGGGADPSGTATVPAWSETGNGHVDTQWWVRAERSGREVAGRTYTISGTATFTDGSCSISAKILVPHDMRPSNR